MSLCRPTPRGIFFIKSPPVRSRRVTTDAVREQLLRIIEPISGAVSIVSYEKVSDNKGKVQGYRVLATRD